MDLEILLKNYKILKTVPTTTKILFPKIRISWFSPCNSSPYLVDDDNVGGKIDHLPKDHYNAQAQNYPVTVMFDESEM